MEFSDTPEISLYGKSSNAKWPRTPEGLKDFSSGKRLGLVA